MKFLKKINEKFVKLNNKNKEIKKFSEEFKENLIKFTGTVIEIKNEIESIVKLFKKQ